MGHCGELAIAELCPNNLAIGGMSSVRFALDVALGEATSVPNFGAQHPSPLKEKKSCKDFFVIFSRFTCTCINVAERKHYNIGIP